MEEGNTNLKLDAQGHDEETDATIESLRAQIQRLQKEGAETMESLQAQIQSLQKDNTTKNSTITDLQKDCAEQDKTIENLREKIHKYKLEKSELVQQCNGFFKERNDCKASLVGLEKILGARDSTIKRLEVEGEKTQAELEALQKKVEDLESVRAGIPLDFKNGQMLIKRK